MLVLRPGIRAVGANPEHDESDDQQDRERGDETDPQRHGRFERSIVIAVATSGYAAVRMSSSRQFGSAGGDGCRNSTRSRIRNWAIQSEPNAAMFAASTAMVRAVPLRPACSAQIAARCPASVDSANPVNDMMQNGTISAVAER